MATKQVKIDRIHKAGLFFGGLDLANLGTIFSMYIKPNLQLILATTLRFYLFPLAVAFTAVDAVLAWREAFLDTKIRSLGRALVNTAVFIAVTVAVVGALAFASSLGAAAPIIFSAVFGLKSLYHLGTAAWYFAKSRSYEATKISRFHLNETLDEKTERKKQSYREIVKTNLIQGIVGGLSTITIATMMAVGIVFVGAVPVAALGVAAVGIGLGFVGYKAYQMSRTQKVSEVRLLDTESANLQSQVEPDNDHQHGMGPGAQSQPTPSVQQASSQQAPQVSPSSSSYILIFPALECSTSQTPSAEPSPVISDKLSAKKEDAAPDAKVVPELQQRKDLTCTLSM